jgi:dolichol-phosphate mannosyltransferase
MRLPRPTSRVASLFLRGGSVALIAGRLLTAARQPQPLKRPDALAVATALRISVVVPARDEALRIEPLLQRLAGAPGVLEVIVVDDQSADGTAERAVAAGVRVVAGAPLPVGWAGKAWALQQGFDAVRADAEWIVTLDADTRPDPVLPLALVSRMERDGADFATVAGSFECPTSGVGWLHPAMLTTLVYRFGAPGTQRRAERLLANGQCMAFRRGTVTLVDVAGQVVEDVALARRLAADGRRVAMYPAPDLLVTRMFEDFVDTWRGWGRSLSLPGVEPMTRQVGDLVLLAATTVLPLARLVARRADPVDAAALAMRFGTLVGTRRSYHQVDAVYWLSPLADPVAAVALAAGMWRRGTTWRGRRYP